jgi:uncharacterized HAD superfamily protein
MDLNKVFDDSGKTVSPILPEGKKNFLIDIDGTISEDVPNEEPERMEYAYLIPGAREMINEWYDEGHIITFFTSRIEDHREVTEKWLNKHGFKYHGLLMGKPRGGNYHWIDNHIVRATQFKTKWDELVDKETKIQVFKGD